MKNRIIASLVGGLIIFIWQFLSWNILGIHDGGAKYHPQQDALMNTLSSTIQEDGMYFLPNTPPGASNEEKEKLMKEMEGRPMASITYIKSNNSDMVRNMLRGFLVDVFLVYLLIYIVTRGGNPPFVRWIAASVSTGLFTFLWGPYTGRIWFQLPWDSVYGYLIDGIVPWAICGIWVGWYMNRLKSRI
jgi:hypothetical protein